MLAGVEISQTLCEYRLAVLKYVLGCSLKSGHGYVNMIHDTIYDNNNNKNRDNEDKCYNDNNINNNDI